MSSPTEVATLEIGSTEVSFVDGSARAELDLRVPFYFVVGSSSDTAGMWTGTVDGLTEYYNGLTLLYVPLVAGASNGDTLNLNNLGSITIYWTNTSVMTTQFSAGTPIIMTYYDGYFRRADYNANTTYSYFANLGHANGNYVANSAIYRYQLLFHVDRDKLTPLNNVNNGASNTSKTMLTSVEFDPADEIFYYSSTTTVAADGAINAGSLYNSAQAVDLRYSFNITTSTLTSHKDVYLKVTLNGTTGKCTLASDSPLTQTLPASDDGYMYMLLGRAYSGYQISLYKDHPLYYHNGTKVMVNRPM